MYGGSEFQTVVSKLLHAYFNILRHKWDNEIQKRLAWKWGGIKKKANKQTTE